MVNTVPQRLSSIVFSITLAGSIWGSSAMAQERGGLPAKTWSCQGNVWVFNGVELGLLDRGKLALMLGDRMLPSGCYWYDGISGMFGPEGGPPAGDLSPGLELGGPLRADASNGNTGIFVNGREMTSLEVQNLKTYGVSLSGGRYWLNPQGTGGREGKTAEFHMSAAQAIAPSPSSSSRAQTGTGNDHLYQSGETYGGVQGKCVFISGPGYGFMGGGC